MTSGAFFVPTLTLLSTLHLAFAVGSYESFRQKHGGADVGYNDAARYEARRDLFHRRKAEALAHNALNRSWKMTVNRFSDHTDAELQSMLGYKRSGARWGASGGSSFLQTHEQGEIDTSRLASEVDWRTTAAKSGSWVKNQGACGSCWAVASVGALEMHNEKATGVATKLSHQQLVDCVPNPRSCGGTGGCDGATAELAYQFTRKYGISAEEDYHSIEGSQSKEKTAKCNAQAPTSLNVAHFVRLPINSGTHLIHALATKGPVVVSADGGGWFGYSGGVYSGCAKDTVVNHAVLAVGYGHAAEHGKDYYLIRNSWGPDWGEHGFIKVERHAGDSDYCGTDYKPKDGVYCADAPEKITVCGMCGVTSDSVYPSVMPSQSVVENRNRVALRSKLVSRYMVDSGSLGTLHAD